MVTQAWLEGHATSIYYINIFSSPREPKDENTLLENGKGEKTENTRKGNRKIVVATKE